jgi:hypothetical protein
MALCNELANFQHTEWRIVRLEQNRPLQGKARGGLGLLDPKAGTPNPTHGLSLKTRQAQSKIRLRACQRLPLKRLFSRH